MNVDLIFQIAAIGILVAVMNQVLVKSGRDDYFSWLGCCFIDDCWRNWQLI